MQEAIEPKQVNGPVTARRHIHIRPIFGEYYGDPVMLRLVTNARAAVLRGSGTIARKTGANAFQVAKR